MPTNPQSQGQVEAKPTVLMEAQVEISIKDRDVIERVTGPGGDEWRSQLYNLRTEDDVLNHLAYNAVAGNVERVNQLDGWADLPDDAATMQVVSFHVP
jgi:hypothetical protein